MAAKKKRIASARAPKPTPDDLRSPICKYYDKHRLVTARLHFELAELANDGNNDERSVDRVIDRADRDLAKVEDGLAKFPAFDLDDAILLVRIALQMLEGRGELDDGKAVIAILENAKRSLLDLNRASRAADAVQGRMNNGPAK